MFRKCHDHVNVIASMLIRSNFDLQKNTHSAFSWLLLTLSVALYRSFQWLVEFQTHKLHGVYKGNHSVLLSKKPWYL